MSAVSRQQPCANHPASPALGQCVRCRAPLCDACVTFAINDDPWCEACGSVIEEESRPRYGRGAIVLGLVWGITTALWTARILFLPMPIPYFGVVLLLGYGGGLYSAWNAASPVAGVQAPTIVRRAPGGPLPRRLR